VRGKWPVTTPVSGSPSGGGKGRERMIEVG